MTGHQERHLETNDEDEERVIQMRREEFTMEQLGSVVRVFGAVEPGHREADSTYAPHLGRHRHVREVTA